MARAFAQRLRTLLDENCAPTLLVCGYQGQDAIGVPASVAPLLLEALEGIASGNSVIVIYRDTELTTQQAADFLSVSRPYLVGLLESGAIPYRKIGTHRRVQLDAVRRYKSVIDAARRRALDELAADAQDLGLGY